MGVLNDAFNKNQTGQLLNKAARQGQQLLPLLRHPLGMAFVENRKPQDPSRLPIIIFHHLPQKKMTITWRIPQKSHRVDHQFPFLKNSHFGTIPPFQTRPKDKKLQPASACAVRGAQTGDPTAGINLRRMFRYTGNLEFSAFHTSTV
jgi:hypothetical protein